MNRTALRRRMVLGTAATFAGNGWAMVVSLVTLPILLRGLGPEQFGLWALIQTLSAVTGWASLIHFGPGTAVTRAVAATDGVEDREARGRAIGSGLVMLAGCALLAAALVAVVGPIAMPHLFSTGAGLTGTLREAVLIFAVQTLADAMTESIESCLEGMQRVDISRAVDGARRTAVAALVCPAALTHQGLVGVATASCVGSYIGLGVGASAMAIVARRQQLAVSRAAIRELLRDSRSIALLKPLGVAERAMDRTVVGLLLGPTTVAVVEVATQVANGAASVLSASAYSVVPASSWLSTREDAPGLRALLNRGTRFSVGVTLPVVAIVMIIAAPALRVWVGSDAAYGPTLVALSTIALAAPVAVGGELLIGIGRASLVLRATVAALAVNLVATVTLVHAIGIVGTFLGTVVAEIVFVPLLCRAFLPQVGESAPQFVRGALMPALPPLLALGSVGLAASRLPFGDAAVAALAGAAGLAAYAATLLVTRGRDGRGVAAVRRLVGER
ncbi:MAG TPA: oligosaccharide flippase family protein [Candidatus Dormibacteraeota bacterium]|nr:oligosaccharide flippase family protein [Candidatus Dormibacteraeota bacterium]